MRPLTASAAPQTSVMMILGILKSKKTVITFSSALPVMRAARSWNVRLNVPVTRLVMTTAMSRMTAAASLYELRILPTPLLDDIDEERQADHCDDSIDRRFIEHPCEHIGQGKDDCAEQPGIDDCIFVHIAVYHLDDMRYQKTEEYDVSDHPNGDAREHDGNDERQPFVQSAVLTEGDRHFIAEQKDIQFFCHHIQSDDEHGRQRNDNHEVPYGLAAGAAGGEECHVLPKIICNHKEVRDGIQEQ